MLLAEEGSRCAACKMVPAWTCFVSGEASEIRGSDTMFFDVFCEMSWGNVVELFCTLYFVKCVFWRTGATVHSSFATEKFDWCPLAHGLYHFLSCVYPLTPPVYINSIRCAFWIQLRYQSWRNSSRACAVTKKRVTGFETKRPPSIPSGCSSERRWTPLRLLYLLVHFPARFFFHGWQRQLNDWNVKM